MMCSVSVGERRIKAPQFIAMHAEVAQKEKTYFKKGQKKKRCPQKCHQMILKSHWRFRGVTFK